MIYLFYFKCVLTHTQTYIPILFSTCELFDHEVLLSRLANDKLFKSAINDPCFKLAWHWRIPSFLRIGVATVPVYIKGEL